MPPFVPVRPPPIPLLKEGDCRGWPCPVESEGKSHHVSAARASPAKFASLFRAPFDSRKGLRFLAPLGMTSSGMAGVSGCSHKAAPPSTVIMEPVTPLASSDAANRKALAKSSGIMSRPMGVLERLPS